MPAHMESPLDVTHHSWYRTDGTARTIRSGVPSLRSTTSHSSSTTHQPNSQPESRKFSDHDNRERAPSSRPSASASSQQSTTSSTRRARGPRPQPELKPDPLDIYTGRIFVQPKRPTVDRDRRLAAPVNASAEEARTEMLAQSQPKRHAQAGRFRVHARARAISSGAGASPTGAARDQENVRRARVAPSVSTSHLPIDNDGWIRTWMTPPSQDDGDVQKGESWYRPAPPKPAMKDNKDKEVKDKNGVKTRGRRWYVSVISRLGSGKA